MIGWRFTAGGVTVDIVRRGGIYVALVNGEDVGGYATPAEALDDLAGGHTFSPPDGIETDRLGLPDDLSDWEPLRRPA